MGPCLAQSLRSAQRSRQQASCSAVRAGFLIRRFRPGAHLAAVHQRRSRRRPVRHLRRESAPHRKYAGAPVGRNRQAQARAQRPFRSLLERAAAHRVQILQLQDYEGEPFPPTPNAGDFLDHCHALSFRATARCQRPTREQIRQVAVVGTGHRRS